MNKVNSMIREEIEKSRSYQSGKAAVEYANSIPQFEERKKYCIEDFEAGVEWSDEHPRKGLVDINKVVEWLEGMFGFLNENGNNFNTERFIKNFKDSMEEL